MSPGEHWPRHPPTAGLEKDPPSELSELSKQESRRMRRAIMRGRPLPPRLARAAVQYAPKFQRQAQLGYLMLGVGLLAELLGTWSLVRGFGVWQPVTWLVLGVLWLLLGVRWFRVVRRAGRAVRDGCWPEQPGEGG